MNKTVFLERVNAPYTRQKVVGYEHVQDFIKTELPLFRPDFLLINQGFWFLLSEQFRRPENFNDVAQAMLNITKYSFWKRTTSNRNQDQVDSQEFLEIVRKTGLLQYNAFALTEEISHYEH